MEMRRAPGRARTVGVFALIALLGLPVALAGHHHASLDPARDCSSCIVAHLSPAEGTSPVTLQTVLVSRPLGAPSSPVAVPSVDRPAHPGRAPPALLAV
jgi:hypothetical protein